MTTSPAPGRRYLRRVPFAAQAALLMASGLILATSAPRAESLEEAWRVSTGRDLTLAAASNRVAAAEAELAAARADRRPIVSASANAFTFDETPAFDFSGAGVPAQLPLFAGSSMLMADARITLPFYTSGMTRHAVGAAESNLAAEQHVAGSLSQQVKLTVAERYLDVLRTASAALVAEGNVASLAAHLREVEDLYRGGGVPRNDFLAASVSLADAEQRRLQTRNALDTARASYNRLLGRPLVAETNLDANLPEVDTRITEASLDALTAMAVAQREELQSLEASAAALQSRAEATEASSRPQLAITGGYTHLENNVLSREDYWTVGVGLNWNLFDAGRTRGRAASLSLQSSALLNQRRDLETIIGLEVRRTWLMREETAQRVSVTQRAVEQAEENLRVVRDRYRNGEGTNSEVLDAEALRTLSLGNYDNARYDAAIARYRLARAVGLL